ncbi:unnamed protein product [Acanthoscelides obtectus]|uniref:Uncharacterized protein n=1 Tax=Acanthoscelides obtectus TaxID=200917 RepID=A0A9P0LRE0_ACAOB|nr:unnamed protein product [Acanthoscelides obtectus]CAK1668571.1 hypothetical protein AOBTE_LOCUS26493 [Acanthoscelides obtectus]
MRFHPNSLYQIKHQWMVSIESTAKLVGNTLTIESIPTDGRAKSLTRVYTFTDTGIEVVVTMNDGGSTTEAKRIYKRQ